MKDLKALENRPLFCFGALAEVTVEEPASPIVGVLPIKDNVLLSSIHIWASYSTHAGILELKSRLKGVSSSLDSRVEDRAVRRDKMNPPCARCKKTVYPTEKLSCLDKIWHKGCFTCEVCNLKLTMKNYKGYSKLPYCQVHYPTTKFTAVADTPENKRLAKNTQQQSNIVYHKDFESEKGKFTVVEEDPEIARLKKNTMQSSDLAYKSHSLHRQDRPPEPVNMQTPAQPVPSQPAPAPVSQPPPKASGPRYVAIYDYAAADDDEVSFQEGDIIVNGEQIDEGWMTGCVERTGQSGMLPSNYVERC